MVTVVEECRPTLKRTIGKFRRSSEQRFQNVEAFILTLGAFNFLLSVNNLLCNSVIFAHLKIGIALPRMSNISHNSLVFAHEKEDARNRKNIDSVQQHFVLLLR